MPSRWQEPFGIVGPEALAAGTPVVAWDSGGIREWHQGELVPWGDVVGLARVLRTAVGQQAREAAGLDRVALMDRLLRLYAEVAVRGTTAAETGHPSGRQG
jgi:glycosyltransferase involved in cell wall biosynthesis